MRRENIFAIGFVTLTVGVIIIIVVTTSSMNGWKDYSEHEDPFWQTGVVYQVYPRSFSDSDDDGIGDLKGIVTRTDYLKELGVGMVWIRSIYESSMKSFGYEIINYTSIDPIFGNMEDFDHLVDQLHRRGLKVVMDFVPNHSSDEHEWFQRSEALDKNYIDYYVWADSNGTDSENNPIPPNNWMSVLGGSAWEWSQKRGQFYYHQFLKEQPDLNYRSIHVRKEMENVLKFWLDKGVDGFIVDGIKYLVEVNDLTQDEPLNFDGTRNNVFTANQPESFEVLWTWRQLVDKYHDKVLMVEVYSEVKEVMEYYGNETFPLAHFPLNVLLLESLNNRSTLTGYSLKNTISLWLDFMPKGKWPNWVVGNHDNRRVASRVGRDLMDAVNMILLLLPGTPVTYYGEEIGMEDTFISYEDTMDPEGCLLGPDHYQEQSRDPERTPMQWNSNNMAGFTSGNDTWLPINPNYKEINVEAQKNATQSNFKFYQILTQIRREETFKKGVLTFPNYDTDIFSFIRSLEGHPSYLAVINIGEEERVINLHLGSNFPLPHMGKVILSSSTNNSTMNPESDVFLDKLCLLGGEGLLLKLPNT